MLGIKLDTPSTQTTHSGNLKNFTHFAAIEEQVRIQTTFWTPSRTTKERARKKNGKRKKIKFKVDEAAEQSIDTSKKRRSREKNKIKNEGMARKITKKKKNETQCKAIN